jgi:hypothetical protein
MYTVPVTFFSKLFFFSGRDTFLRFYMYNTVMIPAANQETVGEVEVESGTAAWQPGVSQWT